MSPVGHDARPFVAEQPTLEQQVALLREQLAQAQKLTALGELVSTTTHEFNNVLMTIINYAKMGMRHKDAPTRDKAFDKILAAGHRAAQITNGILGFAAIALRRSSQLTCGSLSTTRCCFWNAKCPSIAFASKSTLTTFRKRLQTVTRFNKYC